MENKGFQPDDMERLLRETFLNQPELHTEDISDMMAEHAYSTDWQLTPPAHKATTFTGKFSGFPPIILNPIIICVVLVIGIGTAAYFGIFSKKETSVSPDTQPETKNITINTESDIFSENTSISEEITVPDIVNQTTHIKKTEPIQKIDTTSRSVFNNKNGFGLKDTAIAATPQPIKPVYPRPYKPKPRPGRFVMIPHISDTEAKRNEERKAEMVKQIQENSKKHWSFIPSGTVTENGNTYSIQAFYMQIHEVSNLQYRTFLFDLVLNERYKEYEVAEVHDNPEQKASKNNIFPLANKYFWTNEFDNYPVVNITYEGAYMYCLWLTELVNEHNVKENRPFINDIRLPLEKEWMYAAKAGNDSAMYAWQGEVPKNRQGNFLANYNSPREPWNYDGHDITAPVSSSSFAPNPWALMHICGNVSELTRLSPDSLIHIKGGAWNQGIENLEIQKHIEIHANDLPLNHVGFRPVFTYLRTKNK